MFNVIVNVMYAHTDTANATVNATVTVSVIVSAMVVLFVAIHCTRLEFHRQRVIPATAARRSQDSARQYCDNLGMRLVTLDNDNIRQHFFTELLYSY